jgi:Cdc6-like AAA superfamily ATPase
MIEDFLIQTINRKNSGLMYLCGHPGTGKTSSLNAVLAKLGK